MVIIQQTITTSGMGLKARDWRQVLISAWEAVGKYWHDVIMPKHFTVAGGHEYRYAKRTKEYMERKGMVKHHQRPLVWSGDTESEARTLLDVRAKAMEARVVLHLPRYVYQYRKKSTDPDKAGELQALSDADGRELARVLDAGIQAAVYERDAGIGIEGYNAAGERVGDLETMDRILAAA